MLNGAISSQQGNSFTAAGKSSGRDVRLDKTAENNRFLNRLFGYCTAVGTVLGALIAMYVLRSEINGTTLFVAALCYSSVGAISGILVAGFYDVIARGSLEENFIDE